MLLMPTSVAHSRLSLHPKMAATAEHRWRQQVSPNESRIGADSNGELPVARVDTAGCVKTHDFEPAHHRLMLDVPLAAGFESLEVRCVRGADRVDELFRFPVVHGDEASRRLTVSMELQAK